MRKFIVMGVSVVMAMAVMVGAIFAQDDTTTTDAATRAWLGIAVRQNDNQVLIVRVQSGSPADAADLLIGDAIVAFNGTAINVTSDLSEQVQAASPGDSVTLEIVRNGETVSVDVTLGTVPAVLGRGNRFGRDFNLNMDAISIAERLLNADLVESDGGFEVVDILANRNPFALEAGDVVTSVNGQAVSELNLETLATDLRAMEAPELTVVVVRGGEEVTLNGAALFGGRDFGNREGNSDGKRGRVPGMGGPMNPPPPAQDAAPSTDPAGDV